MDTRPCPKQIIIVVMDWGFIGSVLKNHYKILSRRVKGLIFGIYYLMLKHGSERNTVRESSGEVKAELGEELKAWVEAGRSCHKCGQV